jgi:hypothetical protein
LVFVQSVEAGRGFRWAGGNGAAFAVVGGKISAAGKTISRIVISQRVTSSMLTAWTRLVRGCECAVGRKNFVSMQNFHILQLLFICVWFKNYRARNATCRRIFGLFFA